MRTNDEQWLRDELPSTRTGRGVAKSMLGMMGATVQPSTKFASKKEMIANLSCEVGNISIPAFGTTGNACVWRADASSQIRFLGYPLELVLSSNTQMGKAMTSQKTADSVNLKAAYDPSVFQVPSAVKNMPFYADEPSYTQPEKEDADLDCKTEKNRHRPLCRCGGASQMVCIGVAQNRYRSLQ